jgi:hypothetical protein
LAEACSIISRGKGLSIDAIPDTILSVSNPEMRNKILELVNKIFTEYKIVPSPFRSVRLHLLNKLKEGLPTMDDLRPIMISSPIMKAIEAMALTELKSKLELEIATPQIGFLNPLRTQVHILRLSGKTKDIKEGPHFNSHAWSVLFVDFKSAFDRVAILFSLKS